MHLYIVTVQYILVLEPIIYIIFILDGWVHVHLTMLYTGFRVQYLTIKGGVNDDISK